MFRKEKKKEEPEIEPEIEPEVKPKVQEEEKVEETIMVLKELPTQEVRQVKNEDGSIVNLITIEEALAKLLNE